MFFRLFCMLLCSTAFACSGGSADQYTFIKTPTFNLNISPPVSWTFFPVKASDAANLLWFFVGQSNTSVQANQLATAEITACMTEAMIQANLPVQGLTITETYQAFQVENPGSLTTGVGPLYGKVEGGALTQTATAPVAPATTFTWAPFSTPVQVQIQNSLGNTLYTWNIVKNIFMEKLMLSFNARFTSDVTVTGTSS